MHWFVKIGLRKLNFLANEFFSSIMIPEMGVKMNLRIITKSHAADSKIRSPKKIDFSADGTHESHPTAWELKPRYSLLK